MTEYTAEDFARAEFARHPDGTLAARLCTGPTIDLYPWRCSDIPGRSDSAMAEDGFVPVTEAPTGPASVDDLHALWERAERHPEDHMIPAGKPYVVRRANGEVLARTEGQPVDHLAHRAGEECRTLRPATPTRPEGAEYIEAALMGLALGAGKSVATSGYRGMADALAARLAADGWTRGEGS